MRSFAGYPSKYETCWGATGRGEVCLSRGDFKAGKLEFLDMIDAQEHA